MRILIADDQPDVLVALRFLLKAEGYVTETADSPAAILRAVAANKPDLILMDLNYTRDTTSGEEGMGVLRLLRARQAGVPVVVMTAWGSVELAVEAMRRGAVDFVMKPWDNERLVGVVKKHLSAAGEGQRLDGDLELARTVQAGLLPRQKPALEFLEYGGHCRQAGAVGGDSYDYLALGPGRVGLVLADVSGKGIAAALLMANLQAALRSLAWQASRDLGLLVRMLNLQFHASSPETSYATLFFGDWDDAGRRLRWASCGHPPALVLRGDSVLRLESNCAPLGLFEECAPRVSEVELAPGDRVVIYSDGVTEARDGRGGELGEEGLVELLRAGPEAGPAELAAQIAAMSDEPQFDDLTLLMARVR